MAGTATIRQSISITDLGSVPTLAETFTIADVDEQIYQVRSLSGTTAEAISFGSVATTSTQGVAIRLISGGTAVGEGLGIDMVTAGYTSTAADLPHAELLQGEMMWWRPSSATPLLSVKNLSSSVCTYEYVLWGEA